MLREAGKKLNFPYELATADTEFYDKNETKNNVDVVTFTNETMEYPQSTTFCRDAQFKRT